MKQILTVLLYPFSILYDLGTRFRNHLYYIEHKKSFHFDTNVIAVGNLSVGGTGKTPVVEYVLRLLKNRKVATLSRGYGRKTKGFRIADEQDSAMSIGDEPYQFYRKFSDVMVTVGEDRAMAIPQVLYHQENTEVIILDDAYQHRSVIPDFNVLLTEYGKPFFEDYVLPAGRLRESRKNANRADVVVVTKCPNLVTPDTQKRYEDKIGRYTKSKVPVFFSEVKYQALKHVFGEQVSQPRRAFVFTGIANSSQFVKYLKSQFEVIAQQHFSDHFQYKEDDILSLVADFDKVKGADTIMITTEKDMVRLMDPIFGKMFENRPVYYIPIEVSFLKDGSLFDEMVLNSIKTKSTLE